MARQRNWEDNVRRHCGEDLVPLARGVVAGESFAESTLVERVLSGDRQFQTLFCVLFYNGLSYVGEGVTNDVHLADDAASRTIEYMLMGRGLTDFKAGSGKTLAQWVQTAARWRARDVLAERRRLAPERERALSELGDELLFSERMDPAHGNEENSIVSWVEQNEAIGELEKRVLRLRFVEGMTLEESAGAAEVSVSSIRRAQARLREHLALNAERFHMPPTQSTGGTE